VELSPFSWFFPFGFPHKSLRVLWFDFCILFFNSLQIGAWITHPGITHHSFISKLLNYYLWFLCHLLGEVENTGI